MMASTREPDVLSAIRDRLPAGSSARVIAGSRLSEAVLGLRSIRQQGHPYVDSAWFHEAFQWSRVSGELLTTLCTTPHGVPGFLLAGLESPGSWSDQLCCLLSFDDETVRGDLGAAFRQRVPEAVEVGFTDARAGLATVIGQLDHYVSTILNPMWLRVSMALSAETDLLETALGSRPTFAAVSNSAAIIPTAFGGRPETFDRSGRTLVSIPIVQPAPVLHRKAMPRPPLAKLIGPARATILYALEREMTVRDLARITGQRQGNVLHHLNVLCHTNLVVGDDVTRHPPRKYWRSELGELLLDSDANRLLAAAARNRSGATKAAGTSQIGINVDRAV
jgi:hypothetical protein